MDGVGITVGTTVGKIVWTAGTGIVEAEDMSNRIRSCCSLVVLVKLKVKLTRLNFLRPVPQYSFKYREPWQSVIEFGIAGFAKIRIYVYRDLTDESLQ